MNTKILIKDGITTNLNYEKVTQNARKKSMLQQVINQSISCLISQHSTDYIIRVTIHLHKKYFRINVIVVDDDDDDDVDDAILKSDIIFSEYKQVKLNTKQN